MNRKERKLADEFERVFDEFSDALYRHTYFKVNNTEQAQDLTQDTFMKCWDYVCKNGAPKSWKSLLYRILTNTIIDFYRKKKSTSLDALLEKENVHEGHFDELTTTDTSTFDQEHSTKELNKQLATLPETDRSIILLRIIDELPAKEVAKILSIKPNAVHVRLHRALEKLKLTLINHEK